MINASMSRALLCLALAAFLTLLSPGPACYAALSRSLPARGSSRVWGRAQGTRRAVPTGFSASPAVANGVSGSLPVLTVLPGLKAVAVTAPGVPSAGPVESPEVPGPHGLMAAGLVPAQAAGTDAPGALQGLSLASPDFGSMGDEAKAAAREDFSRRMGGAVKASDETWAPGPEEGAPASNDRGGEVDVSGLDELGNPRRAQSPGPDTVDEFSGGGGAGNSSLFGVVALGLPAMGAAASYWPLILERLEAAILVIPMVVVSLILHEFGHARAALRLGEAGPVLKNRGSLRPKDLLTHVDPWWTLILPTGLFAFTGLIVGKAREIDYDPEKLSLARRALMAFAGPAVNLILAGAGALALLGLGALGVGGAVAAGLVLFVLLNVSLAFFNLLPWYPLDGHTIALSLVSRLSPRLARAIRGYDELDGSMGWAPWVPLVAFVAVMAVSGLGLKAVTWVTALLVGSSAVAGLGGLSILSLAGALGLMMGSVAGEGPAAGTGEAAAPGPASFEKPVELLVFFKAEAKPVSRDLHADWIDLKARRGVKEYDKNQKAMLREISAATGGAVSAAALAEHGAAPKAVYHRLNAATLRVEAAKAQGLRDFLAGEGRGLQVVDNSLQPRPAELGSLEDHLAGASEMRDLLQKRWRRPAREGALARFFRALFGLKAPQPKVAVVDSGPGTQTAERLRAVAGPALEKPVLSMARSQAELSLDEILKSMTRAAVEGYGLIVAPRFGQPLKTTDKALAAADPVSRLAESLRNDGHAVVLVPGALPERAVAQAGAMALMALLFGETKPGWRMSMIERTVAHSLTLAGGRPELGRRVDLKAAYKALDGIMEPAAPGWLGRLVLAFLRLIG